MHTVFVSHKQLDGIPAYARRDRRRFGSSLADGSRTTVVYANDPDVAAKLARHVLGCEDVIIQEIFRKGAHS